MTVRLVTTIKRYIGPSADAKPRPGERWLTDAGDYVVLKGPDVPAGSTFLESDTDQMYKWDGATWWPSRVEGDVLTTLEDIKELLSQILVHTEVVRSAAAVMANDQTGSDYPPEQN